MRTAASFLAVTGLSAFAVAQRSTEQQAAAITDPAIECSAYSLPAVGKHCIPPSERCSADRPCFQRHSYVSASFALGGGHLAH